MSLKLAVLASGSGTNFQAMVDAVRRGALDADIRLVICNRPGAKVIERAKAAGIICAVMDHKLWPSREAYDLAVADAILKSGADTVALAGYMRMLTAGFLNAFPHRVVNVHPALLPSFPGIHGAADAQAWGVKITGCTVHLVDEIMDHGEVIIQAAVPAIVAGLLGTALAAWIATALDVELLHRFFGGFLIVIGLRELFGKSETSS